jgi:hypothetical protein
VKPLSKKAGPSHGTRALRAVSVSAISTFGATSLNAPPPVTPYDVMVPASTTGAVALPTVGSSPISVTPPPRASLVAPLASSAPPDETSITLPLASASAPALSNETVPPLMKARSVSCVGSDCASVHSPAVLMVASRRSSSTPLSAAPSTVGVPLMVRMSLAATVPLGTEMLPTMSTVGAVSDSDAPGARVMESSTLTPNRLATDTPPNPSSAALENSAVSSRSAGMGVSTASWSATPGMLSLNSTAVLKAPTSPLALYWPSSIVPGIATTVWPSV